MCRFSDSVVRRPELTLAVDLATRTLTAGVISPTGKDVDAAVLLARMLVPEPMRPGWPDRLHLTRSALPAGRLVALDDRMRYAAAKPVIFPETVVVDHGAIYLSATFQRACRTLGISLQPARPYTPTDKSVVPSGLTRMGASGSILSSLRHSRSSRVYPACRSVSCPLVGRRASVP